ncbi:MAG: site-specific integrase [Lachnospiraceae bacterium]|jgi:site-specific recombinase XerD|nr:site-specific integrase [Lachnospiraceae bacterium]
MKTTDFATSLGKFLTSYLPSECGSSPRTIETYRYAFILFLNFMSDIKKIKPEKITLQDFKKETIVSFLSWLESERSNSTATRNIRLAALKSFVHYLSFEYPDYLDEYQSILAIPMKHTYKPEISYMKTDGVKLLISQINLQQTNGLRDYVMLMLMYTTGIRVSEIINILVGDLSLSEPCTLLVHGKGNKSRYVPILQTILPYIRKYLSKMNYESEDKYSELLFKNHMGKQFTRQGINYIFTKYGQKASKIDTLLVPSDLSPHKMRHTTAMELLESGVDLMYIRDLLGHSSVTTTEVYARADANHKRKAIEAASKEIVPQQEAKWDNNLDLREWLKSFNRQ